MSLPARSSLIACMLLGALAAPGSSQVVRGRILDRSAGVPVEGGVVTLLDTAGVEVAQVLSHASGWYALSAPAPGRYHLRAERIGYQDVVTQPFTLTAGQVLDRDLAASVRAVALEGLTVRGKGRCELRPEQGVQTQALWSAVRTALTATKLTKVERRLRFDVVQYTRDLSPLTLEPTGAETSQLRSGLAEHPFVSAPVDELMRGGFVRRGAETTSYYAPDAEVLLSDAFLDGHCFQVVVPGPSDTAEAGEVGLEFRPVSRREVSDVRGTLWVDAATHELRRLVYRYTDLDVPDADKLGGRVDFTRIPSGGWIVSSWYVRMPVTRPPVPRQRMSDPTPGQLQPHLARILEQGGAVIGARDAQGERVYTEANPVDAERAEPERRRAAAELGGAKPAGAPADDRACPDSLVARGEGRLQGVVRRGDTWEAVPAATIVVEWTRSTPVGADPTISRSTPERATARSDSAGRYTVCGLPVRTRLRAYALAARGSPVVADLTLLGRQPVQRDLSVAPEVAQGSRGEEPGARAETLAGHVVDAATGEALPNVEVMLSGGADSTGASRGTMSGAGGAFVFEDVRPGEHWLRAVSVGYVAGAWKVQVGAAGLAVRLELQSRPVPLEGLRVQGHARARLGGFYTRREQKLGTFIDRTQIERAAPKRPSDLMRLVPGLRIICPGFSISCTLRTWAPPAIAGVDAGDCPMQYFVDGSLSPDFQLDDLLPDEIEAIEVYTHAASVPARFNIGVKSRCGVIVIWTRTR